MEMPRPCNQRRQDNRERGDCDLLCHDLARFGELLEEEQPRGRLIHAVGLRPVFHQQHLGLRVISDVEVVILSPEG